MAAGAVLVGAAALAGALRGSAAAWYLRGEIAGAASAEAEAAALCRANRWSQGGLGASYQLRAFAGSGAEVRPWADGDFEGVAEVEITWSDGQQVRRRLLRPRALGCLLGE